MFQLILPFQLDLPFDDPEAAPSTHAPPRVRRARVRGAKGGPIDERGQMNAPPSAELCSRAEPRASTLE